MDIPDLSDIENTSLRPKLAQDFIGHERILENMSVFMQAAGNRQEALDHVLLHGPPGLGKTTIAHLIAEEMQVDIKTTSGPLLTKSGDIASILTNLSFRDVLFIDEIHRLNANIEELLYTSMEDYKLDVIIGSGPSAKTLQLDLKPFTLIGATTRMGLLSNPLRDRFGISLRLDFYTPKELLYLILRAANIMKIHFSWNGAREIASRSRGTPRIALKITKRIRDFAEIQNKKCITQEFAQECLKKLAIDSIGLECADYRYMNFLAKNYTHTPVGIDTIAAAISEKKDSIESTIEPYLIQIGFLTRTQRGRLLTPQALTHIT